MGGISGTLPHLRFPQVFLGRLAKDRRFLGSGKMPGA